MPSERKTSSKSRVKLLRVASALDSRASTGVASEPSLERPDEVALECGGDPGDELLGWCRGDRFEAQKVAGQCEAGELGGDEVAAQFGLVGAELGEQRAEQARAYELMEQRGGARLGRGGAEQGEQRVALALVVPDTEEELAERFADVVGAAGEQAR